MSHSTEPMRKIIWSALILLPVALAGCGGSTQALTGTAPSIVTPMTAAENGAGTLALLKEGKGKGPAGSAPTIGTIPDNDGEDGDTPKGPGHGHAMLQIEGFSTSITSDCEAGLIISINGLTVKTNESTEFQRAACEVLADPEATSFHLHIAAHMTEDGLVATYVRMQGPKAEDGEDATTTETPEA